jgi:hypothetical protein
MKMIKKQIRTVLLLGLVFVLAFQSCTEPKNKLKEMDVSGIPAPKVKIKRYEQAMFPLANDSFFSAVPGLQSEFPVFLQGDITDTAALIELKSFFVDPYMQELYKKVMNKYPSLDQVEMQLSSAMRYFKYYFPLSDSMDYYSYISGLDIQFPIKYAGNNLIIGIDNYLGKDEQIYYRSGFPKYKVQWMIEPRIVPDAMMEMASGLMPAEETAESLLEKMIYQGKLLYFTQAMMPDISDTLLLKYTNRQYNWCRTYEGRIWGLMIDNQFLFKKEKLMVAKFMNDGPFTTVFSNTSPARIGWFIGWRIVSEYMNRNEVSLKELLHEQDVKKILRLSKYKPTE